MISGSNMPELLYKLAYAIERGKVDRAATFPPDLKDCDGADELTAQALAAKYSASDILQQALMPGMAKIGDKFSRGEAFIPDLLIAAKAMNAAMVHLQPFFESGEARLRGTVVLGTVAGDLHDIGKNIVKMVLKGAGWKVIDLGVSSGTEKYLAAIEENPGCHVGMSALLTTTMKQMEPFTKVIKKNFPGTHIFIGGAPVSQNYNAQIGADGYFANPHSFARHLQTLSTR